MTTMVTLTKGGDKRKQAVITTATTMEKVYIILDYHLARASHALVAFDVDLTLTAPQHPAHHYPNLQKYLKSFDQLFGSLSLVEGDRVHTFSNLIAKQLLIEANTPTIVKKIQQQPGITTIALTAALTGNLGDLGDLQKRRFKDLKSLSLDFQSAFPCQELILDELPSYNNNYPGYYRGILFANGAQEGSNKGDVLVAFLQKVGWKPPYIVMIDDVLKNLTDIEQALAGWDPEIQFIGIKYNYSQTYVSEYITEAQFINYWQAMFDQARTQTPPIIGSLTKNEPIS